jgi:hypothetical protein
VTHYDRWWNPAVEDQATDRAHRIGQLRCVHVHKLVCGGAVEEGIDALIRGKRELAERVVASGEQALSRLSTDELRELIRLRPSEGRRCQLRVDRLARASGNPVKPKTPWPANGGRSGSRRCWRAMGWARGWSAAGAMPAAAG